MHFSSFFAGLALFAAVLSGLAIARADDDDQADYPLQYARRPLTLHAQSLSPFVAADASRYITDPSSATRALDTNVTVQAGAKFGITRSLEVEASLAQIQILPKVAYGNPTFGATFALLSTVVEVGVRARVTVVTAAATSGMIAEPSVPVQIHLGQSARLDFSAGVPITLQKGSKNTFGLDLPVALALNLIDAIHVGAQTSFYIRDLDNPGTSVTVPLGFFGGLSLGTEHPIVEIDPYFVWPRFMQPGATDLGTQKLNMDVYTAGLAVRGYFYF